MPMGRRGGYTVCSCGQWWSWNARIRSSTCCKHCGLNLSALRGVAKPDRKPGDTTVERAWLSKARQQHKRAEEAGDLKAMGVPVRAPWWWRTWGSPPAVAGPGPPGTGCRESGGCLC